MDEASRYDAVRWRQDEVMKKNSRMPRWETTSVGSDQYQFAVQIHPIYLLPDGSGR